MASRSLGTLTLDLILKYGGFEQGMDKAARAADKRMREIEKRAKQFGVALAAGLVAAGTGLAVALGKSIDRMDELRDSSIRLGIGIETLSAFSFAAKQTGTDIEALGTGFKILAKNMADALNPDSGKAQIFESLGIEVTDATGKLKQFEQIIPEIADKFAQLEDGTTKAALAQELFGKSGLNLIEFLNQGGDGITELTERARELGIVIDQETADKADAFKDTLGELKAAGEGLTTQIAAQLLPALLELAEWARDFAKDGSNAVDIADKLTTGFEVLSTAAHIVSSAFEIVGAGLASIAATGKAAYDTLAGLFTIDTSRMQRAVDLLKASSAGFVDEFKEAFGLEDEKPKRPAGPDFSRVRGSFSQDNIDRNALNRALGGVKDKPERAKKEGKSDEEREAERLKAAYDSLNSSLSERIALFGKEGEAVKVRYDIEHGELAKLAPAQQQELVAKAEHLDLMKAEEEQMRKSADLAQQEADAKLRGVEATAQQIDDMRLQLELYGKSAKEQERMIALRYADVNATDEQRAAIASLSDQIHEAQEISEGWNEVQRSLSDAFYNVAKDAKNAEDYVKGFFDSIADYILRSISEDWAEKIVDIFRGAGGGGATSSVMDPTTGSMVSSGGSGGFWATAASWLGMLFGGGRAIGGGVSAGMFYEVNENGPELLSVGGKDYLMMGNRSGVVTPHAATAGAGMTLINHNHYQAPYDPRVEAQKNARMAFETNRAAGRNR